MKTEISPCCNAEMWLQARWEGKALYQCSECKHHTIPIGMEAYNTKTKKMKKIDWQIKLLLMILLLPFWVVALIDITISKLKKLNQNKEDENIIK